MMLTGQKIRLRAMEPDDVGAMYLWENDTSLWEVGETVMPFSRDALSRFVQNSSSDIYTHRQVRFIIELVADGSAVGAVDLFDFNPVSRKAAVGILIYDPLRRRRGYALEALALVSRYSAVRLGLHQLYALVPSDNGASVALFVSAGFTECGILREWIIDMQGNWKNAVMMQLIF